MGLSFAKKVPSGFAEPCAEGGYPETAGEILSLAPDGLHNLVCEDENSAGASIAACDIISDLIRLADRQRHDAAALIEALLEHHEPASRDMNRIPARIMLLEESVRLQARAVRLVEDVVARTATARVSSCLFALFLSEPYDDVLA